MAFELSQFGIGIKTIEPGGMKTDFFTRSFDTGRHPAYDALVNKVMGIITDPKQMATYSSPEQIAGVGYEAATDGKDQLCYIAGADAKAMYAIALAAWGRTVPQGDGSAVFWRRAQSGLAFERFFKQPSRQEAALPSKIVLCGRRIVLSCRYLRATPIAFRERGQHPQRVHQQTQAKNCPIALASHRAQPSPKVYPCAGNSLVPRKAGGA
jgi:hypothetical protein